MEDVVSKRANILNKKITNPLLAGEGRVRCQSLQPSQNPLVEPLLARGGGLNRSSAELKVKNENEESVLGEGSTLWVNSRLLSFRRPRPKVGDPAFSLPRPLWEREKPCEQSELRIRVRGNLRILSAIGIDQLDSRAAHENDDQIVSWAYLPNKLTPHPACSHLLLLGEGLKKGRVKKCLA